MDCINYQPPKTVFDCFEDIGGGVFVPKDKRIDHRCEKCPAAFAKFWKENGSKNRKDIVFDLECFDPNEFLKRTDKLIKLSEKILNRL